MASPIKLLVACVLLLLFSVSCFGLAWSRLRAPEGRYLDNANSPADLIWIRFLFNPDKHPLVRLTDSSRVSGLWEINFSNVSCRWIIACLYA